MGVGVVKLIIEREDTIEEQARGLVEQARQHPMLRDHLMRVHDVVIAKLNQLPESLAEEVNDFIDLLLIKQDRNRWQLWKQFSESLEMAESDFSDYLSNLENYEERLARGEIQW